MKLTWENKEMKADDSSERPPMWASREALKGHSKLLPDTGQQGRQDAVRGLGQALGACGATRVETRCH